MQRNKKAWYFGVITDVTPCWFDFRTTSGSNLTFLFAYKKPSKEFLTVLSNIKEAGLKRSVKGTSTGEVGMFAFNAITNGWKHTRLSKKIKLQAHGEKKIRERDYNPARGKGRVHMSSTPDIYEKEIVEHIFSKSSYTRPEPKCPRKKIKDPVEQHNKVSESAKKGWETRRSRREKQI